jgi:GGDEF domain-containing protein
VPAFEDPNIRQGLLDSLQVGVCVIDLQRKIVFWSDGAEPITRNLRREVVDRPSAGRTLSQCDCNPCEACSSECPVGAAIQALESFEDLHQPETGEPREEGVKSSGYANEITGIASRSVMQSHLRETLETFAELRVPFGVLHLRLKGFEVFRANFGRSQLPAGFACWRTRSSLPCGERTMSERWADDQFLVILNVCSGDSLRAVGDRIGRMLASGG